MRPETPSNPLFLREEELDRSLEALFRAATALERPLLGPLAAAGLALEDYRLLLLVRRHAGLTGARLVALTGMTKQTLFRRLAALEAGGRLVRAVDPVDRRRRPLRLTAKGDALLRALMAPQQGRLRRAFRKVGPDAVEGFAQVLREVVTPDARPTRGATADFEDEP